MSKYRAVSASLRVAFFLAVKSILRGNIGVTLLTIFILILIALNLLFVPGLIKGLVVSANDQIINNYSSDIIINPRGKDRHGDEWWAGSTVYGIMPDKEKKVFNISDYLIEGSYLETRDRDKILLGIQLAGSDEPSIELYSRSLRHVHAGDKVTVTYSNGIVKEYTVKGIFWTGFIQTDLQAFVSDLEYESIVPSMRNMATSVHVKVSNNADKQEIIERIRMFREDLDFQTWEQTAGIVNSMTTSFKLIQQILNVVNALVAGITIFIVTYVDVVNRRRQIGILRAIGIKGRPIISSYLMRALFYVIVGLILSWLLFIYVIIPVEIRHPFHFPFGPVFFTADFPALIRTVILLSMVSLVAAFLPVWLIMRIKIMDAIWS